MKFTNVVVVIPLQPSTSYGNLTVGIKSFSFKLERKSGEHQNRKVKMHDLAGLRTAPKGTSSFFGPKNEASQHRIKMICPGKNVG